MTTSPDRWSAVERVYHAALARTGEARAVFLAEACAGDDELRWEVESLLAQNAQDVLTRGAVVAAAELVNDTGRSVLTGRRLGVYHVLAPIGAGGMGEVYRARDTRLGREVAIKILPRAFTADADRLARFEREARVLASLNHPHIAAIYGIEDAPADGGPPVRALILELVEGETLAERIARTGSKGLPVNEALDIARQIADALDAAHEKGIVHRDLKPANIKITLQGSVKVLDFGLAKLEAGGTTEAGREGREFTEAPTITVNDTREGVVVGTAAYMSPEQARGQTVDKRTDIWAFGCVLYEMLTGRAAFGRETVFDTLAAVLEREPDWSPLPAALPTGTRRLLRHCLEKDSKRRLRDVGDAWIALDAGAQQASATVTPSIDAAPPRRRRELFAWVLAAAALTAFIATILIPRHESALLPSPVARTTIALPAGDRVRSRGGDYPLAMSSDGLRFAYVAEAADGQSQLYVRELNALEPRAIAGTEGAQHPFFSPDGQWVGFFASGALQRVAVTGGPPVRVCSVPALSVGGSWGRNNLIVFATRDQDLAVVDIAGGTPRPLAGSRPASWPQILPDGKTVLFTHGVGVGDAIVTMSLSGGAKRIVARTGDSKVAGPAVLGTGADIMQARYVETGHLVYGQDPGIIRAVAFDLPTLTVTGAPVSIVDRVERAGNAGAVYFAMSSTGSLLYASRGGRHQLVWVERNGTETPVSADRAAFRHPRLSPDGRRIAVAVYDETRHPFIWLYDVDRGTKVALNIEGLEPVWSPDGTRLFVGAEDGSMVEVPVERTSEVTTLISRGPLHSPAAFSPDGQQLVFYQINPTGIDLGLLSLTAGSVPRVLLHGPSSNFWPHLSPNGRWIAYVSTESGAAEVYVRRFPDLAEKIAVSGDGGTRPRWSHDGRELFYRHGEAMMAVAVDTRRGFSAGKAQRLFAGSYEGEGRDPAFDVTADGHRFLMIKTDPVSTLQRLTLVQNWDQELKRLVASAAPGR